MAQEVSYLTLHDLLSRAMDDKTTGRPQQMTRQPATAKLRIAMTSYSYNPWRFKFSLLFELFRRLYKEDRNNEVKELNDKIDCLQRAVANLTRLIAEDSRRKQLQ